MDGVAIAEGEVRAGKREKNARRVFDLCIMFVDPIVNVYL